MKYSKPQIRLTLSKGGACSSGNYGPGYGDCGGGQYG